MLKNKKLFIVGLILLIFFWIILLFRDALTNIKNEKKQDDPKEHTDTR
jgi:hypothetical protein